MILRITEDSAHCAVQTGDAFLIGGIAAGAFGDHEDSMLLTLSAGPDNRGNDIEVAIPKRYWESFVATLASGKYGQFNFD